jgi:hypothetical protein
MKNGQEIEKELKDESHDKKPSGSSVCSDSTSLFQLPASARNTRFFGTDNFSNRRHFFTFSADEVIPNSSACIPSAC